MAAWIREDFSMSAIYGSFLSPKASALLTVSLRRKNIHPFGYYVSGGSAPILE